MFESNEPFLNPCTGYGRKKALSTSTDMVAEEPSDVKTSSSLALEQSRQRYDSIACQPFIVYEFRELHQQGQDDADRRASLRQLFWSQMAFCLFCIREFMPWVSVLHTGN